MSDEQKYFKRVTLSINSNNLEELDLICMKKGMNRTSLINLLISEHIREEKLRELKEKKRSELVG